MSKSVLLLSGGLDSTVNFKLALDRGAVAGALTFDYGQRAARRELVAAGAMCARFGVRQVRMALPWLGKLAASPLTSRDLGLPHPKCETLDDPAAQSDSDAVWIPNRNGVFVNIAAAHAEAWGAEEVVAGFNAEEAVRFPDNSADYVRTANAALGFSTRGRVRLVSHTIGLDKAAILKLGREIGAPLDLCWYCYEGGRKPCGQCESCLRFQRAAARAGAEESSPRSTRRARRTT